MPPRRQPARARQVRDPTLNRLVNRDGPAYDRLIRTGRLVDTGARALVPQVRVGDRFVVTSIHNPSPPPATLEDRHNLTFVTARNVRRINLVLRGDQRWGTLARHPNPVQGFYASHGAHWEIHGPVGSGDPVIELDRDAAAGTVAVQRMRPDNRHRLLRVQQRADRPLGLPIIGIDLNAAPDGVDDEGACLERFAGFSVPSKTIEELIELCQERDLPCFIYDVFGHLLTSTSHDPVLTRRKCLRGLTFGGHMYVLTTRTVKLVEEPVYPLEDMGDYPQVTLLRERQVYWRNGLNYYTQYGKFVPTNEEELGEWFCAAVGSVPSSYDFPNPLVAATVTQCTLAMQYRSLSFPTAAVYNPQDYVCIDVSKCYWTIARMMLASDCDGDAVVIPKLSSFSTWKPWDPTVAECFPYHTLVQIAPEQIPLGWRSNVMPLAVVPPGTTPIKYLTVSISGPNLRNRAKNDALVAEIDADPVKQKLFARVVGCWGKYQSKEDLHVQVPEHAGRAEELWYYQQHWDARSAIDAIHCESNYNVPMNRYWAYMAVVLTANVLITKAINKIHANTGIYPCMIRTDALTYARSDQVVAQLQRMIDAPEYPYLRWHWQAVPERCDERHIGPPLEIDTSEVYRGPRNITLSGMPGAGKTYRALGLAPNSVPPDIAATYTNRGAARLSATCMDLPVSQRPQCMTVHRLMGTRLVPKAKDYHALMHRYQSGTVIMIDEWQSVPQRFWSMFFFLYERGVHFRFVGDDDQVAAVDTMSLNGFAIPFTPFMGQEEVLKTNYRMDPTVTEWSQQILAETFNAYIDVHTPVHAMNLAFRRSTVDWLNEQFVTANHLVWGGDGKYLVKITNYAKRALAGQVMERDGDTMIRPDGSSYILPVVSRRGYAWGFAMTIHQSVGHTIHEDYTVWDYVPGLWDPAYKRLLYTAVSRAKHHTQLSFAAPLYPLYRFENVPTVDDAQEDIIPRCDDQ